MGYTLFFREMDHMKQKEAEDKASKKDDDNGKGNGGNSGGSKR